MSGGAGEVRVRSVPRIGARVPGFVPRALIAVLGAVLCVVCQLSGFWLAVGLVLTGLAVVVPRRLAAWALLLFLGASRLPHDPSSLDWRFFVLLAGLHLLHVLAALTLETPSRSWVQLDVFRRPLLRFLAIQVPVQLVAVLVLVVLGPDPNGGRDVTLPGVGVAGAAALLIVTLLLAVPLLRERARRRDPR